MVSLLLKLLSLPHPGNGRARERRDQPGHCKPSHVHWVRRRDGQMLGHRVRGQHPGL